MIFTSGRPLLYSFTLPLHERVYFVSAQNMVYGKMTSSTLITNLTREDHNTTVTCSATNPAAPDDPLANSTTLIVHCKYLE